VNASYEVSELECVCCSCETDAVRRPAARLSFDIPTFRQSHATLRVANDSYSCRSTDSIGRATATNHTTGHLRVQCIGRHALTYLEVATPTRRPFCFLQRRLPGSRLAWLPARRVANTPLDTAPLHSVERRIRTARSARGMVV